MFLFIDTLSKEIKLKNAKGVFFCLFQSVDQILGLGNKKHLYNRQVSQIDFAFNVKNINQQISPMCSEFQNSVNFC